MQCVYVPLVFLRLSQAGLMTGKLLCLRTRIREGLKGGNSLPENNLFK